MMTRMHWLFIALGLGVILAAGAVWIVPSLQKNTEDMAYLEQLQENPPDNYILTLESLIRTHPDPYIRERGIFTLTSIALEKNETEKITEFLKDIAINGPEGNVMTAAYANMFFIRQQYPLEKVGSLNLTVVGNIRKNATIKVIATISSTRDIQKAVIGIDHVNPNITVLSSPDPSMSLKVHEPQNLEYELKLEKIGTYVLPFSVILSFDQVDYEKVEKRVFLVVHETSGESISEEEFPSRPDLFIK